MRRGARDGRGADEEVVVVVVVVEACDVVGGEAAGSLSATGSGGVWLESAHGDSSTSIWGEAAVRPRKAGGFGEGRERMGGGLKCEAEREERLVAAGQVRKCIELRRAEDTGTRFGSCSTSAVAYLYRRGCQRMASPTPT
ncbi:hypothetical protein MKX07_004597 [Trichoderma sp. CBMAI-0711]|nr:hypothetical protein MKX07_004597 [Trichoderma sp. CBMAI-0711]